MGAEAEVGGCSSRLGARSRGKRAASRSGKGRKWTLHWSLLEAPFGLLTPQKGPIIHFFLFAAIELVITCHISPRKLITPSVPGVSTL